MSDFLTALREEIQRLDRPAVECSCDAAFREGSSESIHHPDCRLQAVLALLRRAEAGELALIEISQSECMCDDGHVEGCHMVLADNVLSQPFPAPAPEETT